MSTYIRSEEAWYLMSLFADSNKQVKTVEESEHTEMRSNDKGGDESAEVCVKRRKTEVFAPDQVQVESGDTDTIEEELNELIERGMQEL